MVEIIVVGIYMGYWFLDVLNWIWVLLVLVIMMGVNFLVVKVYGELEFWFVLIKIVVILLMIVVGLLMIIVGVGNGGIVIGISNLWNNGGFFLYGIKGILLLF